MCSHVLYHCATAAGQLSGGLILVNQGSDTDLKTCRSLSKHQDHATDESPAKEKEEPVVDGQQPARAEDDPLTG